MKSRSLFGNTSSWLLASLDKFCTLGIEAVRKLELQQSPPFDVSEAFKKRAFSHFVAALILWNRNEKCCGAKFITSFDVLISRAHTRALPGERAQRSANSLAPSRNL